MKKEKKEPSCEGCVHLCNYPDGTNRCNYPMSIEKLCLESYDGIYKTERRTK